MIGLTLFLIVSSSCIKLTGNFKSCISTEIEPSSLNVHIISKSSSPINKHATLLDLAIIFLNLNIFALFKNGILFPFTAVLSVNNLYNFSFLFPGLYFINGNISLVRSNLNTISSGNLN